MTPQHKSAVVERCIEAFRKAHRLFTFRPAPDGYGVAMNGGKWVPTVSRQGSRGDIVGALLLAEQPNMPKRGAARLELVAAMLDADQEQALALLYGFDSGLGLLDRGVPRAHSDWYDAGKCVARTVKAWMAE